jgi:hypothetical protein
MASGIYDEGGSGKTGGLGGVEPAAARSGDYQNIQATPQAFGAQVGQAKEKLGAAEERAGASAEQVSSNAFELAHFQNQIATDQSRNWLQGETNKLLYGDPAKATTGLDGKSIPDTGFLGRQGSDAVYGRQGAMDAFDDAVKQGREKLPPAAQIQYDNETARLRSVVMTQIGSHYDQQYKSFVGDVNETKATQALASVYASPNDPGVMSMSSKDLFDARTNQAVLKYGDTPEVRNGALTDARKELLKAQTISMAVTDPVGADKHLEQFKDVAGSDYPLLKEHLKARVEQQQGIAAGGDAVKKAAQGGVPVLPVAGTQGGARGGAITPARVSDAILGQESGHNPNAATSVTGAVGQAQIEPATFQQYAQPGENIHNPQDNLAVHQRIINDYMQRYGGDAQRVAVAYFSGPGNVAPAGSPTPWVENKSDPNGKSTSSYVYDVSRRLGGTGGSPIDTKAQAYRTIMDDATLSQGAKDHAIQFISRTYTQAQVAAEEDAKALKERKEGAYSDVMHKLMTGDTKNIVNYIDQNQDLTGEEKKSLWELSAKPPGDSAAAYGTGFYDVYRNITAQPGDPKRIGDASEIFKRGGPDGDLTLAGVEKAFQIFQWNQKSVENSSVNRTKVSFLKYAHDEFAGSEDPFMPKNKKGEAIFNSQFVPRFEIAYDKWVKAGNDPMDPKGPVNKENVDKLMNEIYPKRQRNMDDVTETPGAGPQQSTAPTGVNQGAWDKMLATPPQTESGTPFSRGAWVKALSNLAKDPSPENQRAFDESQFGKGEGAIKANEIIQQLIPQRHSSFLGGPAEPQYPMTGVRG